MFIPRLVIAYSWNLAQHAQEQGKDQWPVKTSVFATGSKISVMLRTITKNSTVREMTTKLELNIFSPHLFLVLWIITEETV